MLPPRNVARIRRVPRGLSAVAAFAAILASAPAAVAGTTDDPPPMGKATTLVVRASKEVVKSPQDRIICTVRLFWPELGVQSPPSPAPVGGWADVRCTAPVPEIDTTLNLYRDGQVVMTSLGTTTGRPYALVGESMRCVPGAYTDEAAVRITFPPGFVPPVASVGLASPEAQITC